MNKEKLIPEGMYCYEHTGKTRIETKIIGHEGKLINVKPYKRPETKKCPYMTTRNGENFCEYLQSSEGLLWDSVKECGINIST